MTRWDAESDRLLLGGPHFEPCSCGSSFGFSSKCARIQKADVGGLLVMVLKQPEAYAAAVVEEVQQMCVNSATAHLAHQAPHSRPAQIDHGGQEMSDQTR